MEKFLRIKTRKWRRKFVFFRRCQQWMSGATVVVMPETTASIKYNICFFSALGFLLFIWILQERVIVALLRRLHRSRWGNLYLCGLWQWRYILKLQYIRFAFFNLLTVVFLTPWFVNFFFTFFKASTTTYGHFHQNVSYGIFADRFSLNQIFKFSVSFATEEERNRPSHGCFNRGLCSTKDLKRATGPLSPPTKEWRDLKSLLLSWKTCIRVHLNAWKVELSWLACGCLRFCSLFSTLV